MILAEDIYVFAFSGINALPDKRQTECLKPILDVDCTHLSVSVDYDGHDIPTIDEVIDLCVQFAEQSQ